MAKHLLGILLALLVVNDPAASQYNDGCDVDFGFAYVSLTPWKGTSILLFPSPEKTKQPLASLKYGFVEYKGTNVTNFRLTFGGSDTSEDMYPRLLEIERVDEYGMPVLSFSPDSQWVEVSLDCRQLNNPPSAWLNIANAKRSNIQVKSWTTFFGYDWAIQFLCDSIMAFYSQPNDASRIFPRLTPQADDSTSVDYCMRVLKTAGPWMQVYLESPSTFEGDEDARHARYKSANPPPKVWIRYLDGRGRPRVWYLWD